MSTSKSPCIQRYIEGAKGRLKLHQAEKDQLEIDIVELECLVMEYNDKGIDSMAERCNLKLKYMELGNVERAIDHIKNAINTLK